MPEILVYAIVGAIVVILLIAVLAIKLLGLKPKRGPSSFSHDSHWDSNSSL